MPGSRLAGPVWLETELYNVVAKLPAGTTKDQYKLMLQNLLEERFGLKLHHETRGVPGYELTAWVGVYVRTKTPPEIIAKLNALVTAFVNSPEARNYLATIGATPFPSTPRELGAFQETDTKRWAEIVETAKIEKK